MAGSKEKEERKEREKERNRKGKKREGNESKLRHKGTKIKERRGTSSSHNFGDIFSLSFLLSPLPFRSGPLGEL